MGSPGRALGGALLIAAFLSAPAPALALPEPPARKSDNVSWLASLDEPQVVSARFDGDTMYVSTLKGLAVYDVSNPEAPARIGFMPLPHFENEDVDMSVSEDFVLISNDPAEGKGVLYVIDVSDPAAPALRSQMDTGTVDFGTSFPLYGIGHTASCVRLLTDECAFVYLAGSLSGIDIVDMRDPDHPVYATPRNFPAPEATGGLATHDVQFDRAGRALITGAGGTAIYDVTDPLAPVLVAKTDETGDSDYDEDFGQDGSTLNDLVHHNSHRLPNSSLAAPPMGSVPANDSDVVVVTEEDYSRPTCQGAGSLQTWQIGTDGIMRNLDAWEVEVDPARTALCSAHYFDESGGLLAQGWYEQGTRFLDVTAPAEIRQVGYWIPQKNVTWGAVFAPTDPDREVVYSLDHPRGIDVLRIERGSPPDTDPPPPDESGEPAPDLSDIRPGTEQRPGGGGGGQAAAPPGTGGQARRVRLSVRVRAGRRRPRAGSQVVYRIGVRNRGNAAARDVRVVVRVPRGLSHLRGGRRRRGSRTVIFRLRRLVAGARHTFRMRVLVRRFAVGRRVTVRARVTGRAEAAARPSRLAARTSAMPSATAPALAARPRQRFVSAYGLCRIVVGN